jgi:hypothetical protein
MTKKLAGQVALVTGGSRGIGAATALALAEDGADVAISFVASPGMADTVVLELESRLTDRAARPLRVCMRPRGRTKHGKTASLPRRGVGRFELMRGPGVGAAPRSSLPTGSMRSRLSRLLHGGSHVHPPAIQTKAALFSFIAPGSVALRAFLPARPVGGSATNTHAAPASIRFPATLTDVTRGIPKRAAHRAHCNRLRFLLIVVHLSHSIEQAHATRLRQPVAVPVPGPRENAADL